MSQLDEQSLGRLICAILEDDKKEGLSVLVGLDLARPAAAFASLAHFVRPLGPGIQAEDVTGLLLDTIVESADADMALTNWARLSQAYFSHSGLATLLLGDPGLAESLSRLFGHSQFFADILVRNPEYIGWLQSEEIRRDKSVAVYEDEMAEAVLLFHEDESRRNALCRYHRRELLRIGYRDMMGWAPLEIATAELSDLAEATVRTALMLCSQRLQARHGPPLRMDSGPDVSGFAVIAMGKLGGRELNYSSDIDLVFVYEWAGTTSGIQDATGCSTGSIHNREYFAKLGSELIDLLSRHGPEGYLYRVDMRLRPDGQAGALAPSFAACQNYYLRRARLWERIALLKTRGIAGTPALIDQFEHLAAGFVFAPASPEDLLAEVARLKGRIDNDAAVAEEIDREIKRGRGGIREIEFIVTALEILHGESRPTLRRRATLEAIEALANEGVLSASDAHLLESAYRFFRRIEHALQCMEWRQIHLVPTDETELGALAARCGIRAATRLDAAGRFEAERRRLAEAVHAMFADMFTDPSGTLPPSERSPLRLLDGDCPPDEAKPLLAQWRIGNPAIAKSLRRLAHGSLTLSVSGAGQRRFEQMLPALLESCRQAPWPENAVRHFESFMQACGDASGYYHLLDDNRSILDLLLRLFATSSQLAQRLIANPGLVDPLVSAETFETSSTWLHRAGADLEAHGGTEPDDRLRTLRDLSTLGALRIGARYITELASALEAAHMLSALAEACIETALKWAVEDVVAKEGKAAGAHPPFAVLALGKLGRRELTFLSDLDVVFVSDTPPKRKRRASTDITTFYAHIAERLIFYLTEPGVGGAPFRVDARLRPEGKNSLLVTSIEHFRRHFEKTPEAWEIQTYLGARVVAGERQLGERALRIVADAMARLGDPADVASSIRSMRGRLEATVSPPSWASADFKRGRGGLVDLEFIAQYLQIVHAAERRDLVRAAPADVFAAAMEERWVGRAEADNLAAGYASLRRLETDVRLILETQQTCFPSDPARLQALTYGPGRQPCSPESLRKEFVQCTESVRGHFVQILGGEPSAGTDSS